MENGLCAFLLVALFALFLGGCVQPAVCGNGVCDVDRGENLQNCPRDCQPAETHLECRNQACVEVSGVGANECTADADCQAPPQPTAVCGDERCNVDQGENLQNCPHDCQPACGNGIIDGSEECEIGVFNGKSCSSFGFDAGALMCSEQCTLNTEHCFKLGADYCEKMVENGAPQNKVDIVLVPSHYSDMKLWSSDAALLVDIEGISHGFFSVEPMKSNKSKFNVWKLNLENTMFYDFESMSFGGTDKNAILDVARMCVGADVNMFFLIVNNSQYPSTSGGFGIYPIGLMVRRESGRADDRRVSTRELVHEFGHGFVNLADEYLNSRNIQNFSDRPNADVEGCPKWCSGQLNQNAPCYNKYASFKSCLYQVTENLTKPYPENEHCGFPDLEDCDLGVNCREGTGCYWNAKSLISFKSSPQSIMYSPEVDPFEFNLISQEAILSKINELAAQNN